MNIIPECASLHFNFAPTYLRRDIGILGFIHKRVLEKCHQKIYDFLPMREADQWDKHSKPIDVNLNEIIARQNMFHRSIFGSVLIYNRLSQNIIDEKSVATFQSKLTLIAKARCAAGDPTWKMSFHNLDYFYIRIENTNH